MTGLGEKTHDEIVEAINKEDKMEKKIYKAEFRNECCKLETERCGDIQIEGFTHPWENCLLIYCRKCWNKIIKNKKRTLNNRKR